MEAERADTFKRLLEQDAASKLDFLQAEQQRIDKTQELAGQRKKLMQDAAALSEAENNYSVTMTEFQQAKQAELSTIETKAASLVQEVTKAGQKADLQRLMSPIDGVVQQLAVHTVGGVVTPAQQLLIVVPQDHPVEVEAQVENKDVGFVKEGQPVEIKVETFLVHPLRHDSRQSVVSFRRCRADRKGGSGLSDQSQHGPLDNRSRGQAGESFAWDGRTVEIKTGKRRLIEYLLSPLLKSVKESLRER